MKPRLNPQQASPETYEAMIALEGAVRRSGFEPSLVELVKTRVSQINGCAFCIHMHSTDAMKQGETPERLLLLSSWRESPLYSKRERAALTWAEAMTRLSQTHPTDAEYELLSESFTEEERVKLTLLIATINAWNRFGVGFQLVHPVTPVHAQA